MYKCFSKFDVNKKFPFAVKISRDDDDEKRMAFKNEFNLTKGLEHSNIVRAIELFENDITSETHLVMSFSSGVELQDQIISK